MGKVIFFLSRMGKRKIFDYLDGFSTEAESILPASDGEGESVLLN